MYGGAAGGGKSVALLMGGLQYADMRDYHALILRRTYKQLEKAESIMNLSKEWLGGTDAKWSQQNHTWTFPRGATLEFGHMEHEKNIYDYQGAVYHYVGFDELTQFAEQMYVYLFSRQRRRAGSSLPLRMRAASNPGGVGHEWVKHRFIVGQKPGRIFIPAKLTDNPHLDQEAYIESLAELDPITRAQLLAGDWDAFQGGRFKREWFNREWEPYGAGFRLGERYFLDKETWRFMTCDPAASTSTEADYTVISTFAVTKDFDLVWLDCFRAKLEIPDIVPAMVKLWDRWKPEVVAIEVLMNQRGVYQIARRTKMAVRSVDPGGKDKLVRATKAITLASTGRVWMPKHSAAAWRADAEAELIRFTGDEDMDSHDDVVDTLSYAAQLMTEHEGQRQSGFAPYVIPAR